jgi:Secretion system C-terminal sorting domain
MKQLLLLAALLFIIPDLYAQSTEDAAVEITATTQTAPPSITLHWKPITDDTPTYYLWRKSKTAISWGPVIATLASTDSSYTDTSVIIDSAYEYHVEASGTFASDGYIYAGIQCPAIHSKGAMIVLVDSNFTDSCSAALSILMNDLWGDGWQLIRHDLSRNLQDTSVKAVIASDYATYSNVKAALIVGHIAVPYSGNFIATGDYPPDGHVPYHDGAWPSDIYYSSMTGWTDAVVTNTLASYTANWNVPGDNKFDQTYIPSTAVLQIGRIDVNNMPSFNMSEAYLMNSYLTRDHAYKMDSLGIRHRALINDNFGYFSGEAFAANGWRNFPPLVSRDSMYVIPFIASLADSSFQWAYGCGGGSFTSASGIGASSDFAANPVNGIFTMLFGSYFGDWNVQDNFLRAPLCASTPALTSCWAGRPNWFLHHMALGENIGYGALLTQNNSGLYQPTGYGNTFIHVALMGDLSLRTDYIQPPAALVATPVAGTGAHLTWSASPDPGVIGYYVYRTDSLYGSFTRISGMVAGTSYTDDTGRNGLKYYMVRPVKPITTPSGGYYDLGVGITDTATVTYPSSLTVAQVKPVFTYSLYPDPAQDKLTLSVTASTNTTLTMYVLNAAGQQLDHATRLLSAGVNSFNLNVSRYAAGEYNVVVRTGNDIQTLKWVKL